MVGQLQQVADGLDRLIMSGRRQAPAKISTTTVTTLDTLRADGPLRICDLAEREAMTQPGMTTLINRLEAAGQAERVADPTDGRATLVHITDVGRAVLADRHASRTQAMRAELDRLGPDDRRALIAALPAIERLIAAAPAAPGSTRR